MALTAAQIAGTKKASRGTAVLGAAKLGFAKALFFGHFKAPLLFPYPEIASRRRSRRRAGRRRGAPLRRRAHRRRRHRPQCRHPAGR